MEGFCMCIACVNKITLQIRYLTKHCSSVFYIKAVCTVIKPKTQLPHINLQQITQAIFKCTLLTLKQFLRYLIIQNNF